MPQTEKSVVETNAEDGKVQQLLSLLAPEHIRETRNPFLKSLANNVAQKKSENGGVELSGQTLRNLLQTLESSKDKAAATVPKPSGQSGVSGTNKLTQHDHPAVIATYLMKMPHGKRSSILRILPGSKARKVALLIRELEVSK